MSNHGLGFAAPRDDRGGTGVNWNFKTCKVSLRSPPASQQQSVFFTSWMAFQLPIGVGRCSDMGRGGTEGTERPETVIRQGVGSPLPTGVEVNFSGKK